LIDIKPRIPDDLYLPPEDKRIRPKWEFKMGIFKGFAVENKDLMKKCLEADLENNRV